MLFKAPAFDEVLLLFDWSAFESDYERDIQILLICDAVREGAEAAFGISRPPVEGLVPGMNVMEVLEVINAQPKTIPDDDPRQLVVDQLVEEAEACIRARVKAMAACPSTRQ
jgi:hypothetical protein